ncbi:MAG: site-2 protease family protein [bacterium]|nr:site-2 protease family protein [bacterium]
MNLTNMLISVCIFIMAVAVHEVAHGWTAFRYGDSTASDAGRLTFNPLVHLDLVGSFILPLALILLGVPALGWAKPVPVNFNNLNHPKKDMILVALAGPIVNIIMAILFSIPIRLNFFDEYSFLGKLCFNGIIINLILAIFNMIPVPPLDGSRIVTGLLPWKYVFRYNKLEPYGFIILLIMLWGGLLQNVILPFVGSLVSILIGVK